MLFKKNKLQNVYLGPVSVLCRETSIYKAFLKQIVKPLLGLHFTSHDIDSRVDSDIHSQDLRVKVGLPS